MKQSTFAYYGFVYYVILISAFVANNTWFSLQDSPNANCMYLSDELRANTYDNMVATVWLCSSLLQSTWSNLINSLLTEN